MKCAIDIGTGGMIHTKSLMKIYLRNVKGCNAGITHLCNV
jgi:hypothetical protein